MTTFHAVMKDETGCEFGASVTAKTRSAAYNKLAEDYPESRCVQLESPTDTRRREKRMYQRANDAYWNGANDAYWNDSDSFNGYDDY